MQKNPHMEAVRMIPYLTTNSAMTKSPSGCYCYAVEYTIFLKYTVMAERVRSWLKEQDHRREAYDHSYLLFESIPFQEIIRVNFETIVRQNDCIVSKSVDRILSVDRLFIFRQMIRQMIQFKDRIFHVYTSLFSW